MRQKGFAPILILIIITILGIGFYFLKQGKVIPTPFLSSSPIATVNWKTYTNSHYNYSIKFPSGWSFKEINYSFTYLYPSDQTINSGAVSIEVRDKNAPINPLHLEYKTIETINMEGNNVEIGKLVKGPSTNTYVATLLKNNDIFTFGFSLDKKYLPYFNQILSTFKFLSENSKGICKANFDIAPSSELSAEQDLSLGCSSKQNKTDCEAMGDKYNKNLKDFSTTDGIADCIWI